MNLSKIEALLVGLQDCSGVISGAGGIPCCAALVTALLLERTGEIKYKDFCVDEFKI